MSDLNTLERFINAVEKQLGIDMTDEREYMELLKPKLENLSPAQTNVVIEFNIYGIRCRHHIVKEIDY